MTLTGQVVAIEHSASIKDRVRIAVGTPGQSDVAWYWIRPEEARAYRLGDPVVVEVHHYEESRAPEKAHYRTRTLTDAVGTTGGKATVAQPASKISGQGPARHRVTSYAHGFSVFAECRDCGWRFAQPVDEHGSSQEWTMAWEIARGKEKEHGV